MLHGLQVVAVAVVAQAVWSMARSLSPDRPRATIAVVATLIVTVAPSAIGQVAAILAGAAAGSWLCRGAPVAAAPARLAVPISRALAVAALVVFACSDRVAIAAAVWSVPGGGDRAFYGRRAGLRRRPCRLPAARLRRGPGW
jgi:chromate transporter